MKVFIVLCSLSAVGYIGLIAPENLTEQAVRHEQRIDKLKASVGNKAKDARKNLASKVAGK